MSLRLDRAIQSGTQGRASQASGQQRHKSNSGHVGQATDVAPWCVEPTGCGRVQSSHTLRRRLSTPAQGSHTNTQRAPFLHRPHTHMRNLNQRQPTHSRSCQPKVKPTGHAGEERRMRHSTHRHRSSCVPLCMFVSRQTFTAAACPTTAGSPATPQICQHQPDASCTQQQHHDGMPENTGAHSSMMACLRTVVHSAPTKSRHTQSGRGAEARRRTERRECAAAVPAAQLRVTRQDANKTRKCMQRSYSR